MNVNLTSSTPIDTVVVVTHGLTMRLILMQMYGNFDIFVDQFSRLFQLDTITPHVPYTTLYYEHMPVGC